MKKIKKKKGGFSLMEVVITVTIIIVLSAISGPLYKSYANKAELAEGYALLGAIRSALDNYYADYGHYYGNGPNTYYTFDTTSYDEVLGIDARPNRYYTQFAIAVNAVHSRNKYCYTAKAVGGLKNIVMHYDRTTGLTLS